MIRNNKETVVLVVPSSGRYIGNGVAIQHFKRFLSAMKVFLIRVLSGSICDTACGRARRRHKEKQLKTAAQNKF